MNPLRLHPFHQAHQARFAEVNGQEVVAHYGRPLSEHQALCHAAGLLDLGFRGRLRLSGADARRFLNGQVTNNVKNLALGQGCYALLVNPKGRLESDLNVYCMEAGFLIDLEPDLTARVVGRFEKYIIADDVQVADLASAYGVLSVQGPRAEEVIREAQPGVSLPGNPMSAVAIHSSGSEPVYLLNQPRVGTAGFDLFIPAAALDAVLERLVKAAGRAGGGLCGWEALELARVEAGIPRFGADMDETNLAPEAGIESRAISYTKGCYVGQEVIARIRTYGQVRRTLRGLWLADELRQLPARGTRLAKDGTEVGYLTSVIASPTLRANLALGYVRREANQPGTALSLPTPDGESRALIVDLPFRGPVAARA
jgi:folate-binding protein YgfZ